MSYLFDNEHLLLESLIALCLNKWLDLPTHTDQSPNPNTYLDDNTRNEYPP